MHHTAARHDRLALADPPALHAGLFSFLRQPAFPSFIGFDHAFVIGDMARGCHQTAVCCGWFLLPSVFLIPLAATEPMVSLRKLGGRKWQELHRTSTRSAYWLACIIFWLVKASALLWLLVYRSP